MPPFFPRCFQTRFTCKEEIPPSVSVAPATEIISQSQQTTGCTINIKLAEENRPVPDKDGSAHVQWMTGNEPLYLQWKTNCNLTLRSFISVLVTDLCVNSVQCAYHPYHKQKTRQFCAGWGGGQNNRNAYSDSRFNSLVIFRMGIVTLWHRIKFSKHVFAAVASILRIQLLLAGG